MSITPAVWMPVVTGRTRDDVDEAADSEIIESWGLSASDEDFRRHGADRRAFLFFIYPTMPLTAREIAANRTASIQSAVLIENRPLAQFTSTSSQFRYSSGASLYTDFDSHYLGRPSPYVGNGKLQRDGKGKKKGHAMLIVGYDDAHGSGAGRIQNAIGIATARAGARGWSV